MTECADRPLPWVIVGYGRVGQALCLLADRLEIPIRATWNRTEDAARNAAVPSPNPTWGSLPAALTDSFDRPAIIWLTVVDDAIEPVFDDIADDVADGSVIVHTSGSHSSANLTESTDLSVASLHPLQAISDPVAAVERFSRSFWTIEGDDRAVGIIENFVAPAGIDPIRIDPEAKTLYHAAAVMAANLLVSLLDASIAVAGAADIDESTARQMLVELAGSSLDNLSTSVPAEALTGPAARGDLETIDRHRRALEELSDDSLRQIYDVLTDRALDKLTTD